MTSEPDADAAFDDDMSLETFYDLLEAHDWTYQYSDDHKAWKKGEAEFMHLNNLAEVRPVFRWYLNQFIYWFWRGTPKPARPTKGA